MTEKDDDLRKVLGNVTNDSYVYFREDTGYADSEEKIKYAQLLQKVKQLNETLPFGEASSNSTDGIGNKSK